MKKYIIGFLTCLCIIVCVGASFDNRQFSQTPVFRIDVAQITVSDANAVSSSTMNLNGTVKQITVTMNDNDANATATVSILDEDSVVLWSEADIAENGTTIFQYWTLSSTDLSLAVLMSGNFTVTVDPCEDPTSMTADVVLWGE